MKFWSFGEFAVQTGTILYIVGRVESVQINKTLVCKARDICSDPGYCMANASPLFTARKEVMLK